MYFTVNNGIKIDNRTMKRWIAIIVGFGLAEVFLFSNNMGGLWAVTDWLGL